MNATERGIGVWKVGLVWVGEVGLDSAVEEGRKGRKEGKEGGKERGKKGRDLLKLVYTRI